MSRHQPQKQETLSETAKMLADGKITPEQACDAFKDWLDEWKQRL